MSKDDWIKKLEAKRGRDSLTCVFCNSDAEDECQYGKLYCRGKTTVHYFCLLLATKLDQKGNDREGILGFLLKDIEKQVNGARNVRCCYCSKGGATVYCCGNSCPKVFHLPCGLREHSFHEFYGRFRSFCCGHRRVQVIDKATLVEAARVQQICTICYETVIPEPTPDTLWAPCCKKNAWFHKLCVQTLALNAGYFFKCPLCNNKRLFHASMKKNGIFIPEQDASWERVPHAFDDMYRAYQRCDAVKCQCKKGRTYCERRTVFEIILCKYCGSQGVHKKCGGLNSREKEWGCSFCTNALASGGTQCNSTSPGMLKDSSRGTFSVQEFLSSNVSKRFLPHVRVEKTFTVPPSIRIGEASLKILKRSYKSHERSNGTTGTSKPQVLQCDANPLQTKSDLLVPGCPLREEAATRSCAPKNSDSCNRKLTNGCKINGLCMKETLSSDTHSEPATATLCCLRKRRNFSDLKHAQGAKNQTSLLRDIETSAMSFQSNVTGLIDSVKTNIHQSSYHVGKAISFSSGTEDGQNFTTHAILTTDMMSPESKRSKREKMCGPDTVARELKHLGVYRKHVYLNRMSFTRSGISYLA